MGTQSGAVTNFKNVNVIAVGLLGFRVDGYDDGASISIAPTGDRNTVKQGNDGISAFAEVEGTNVVITLTLLEVSEANDKLSAWLNSSITQGFSYSEIGGTTVFTTTNARVRQLPVVTKSNGVESRAWDIHMLSPTSFAGSIPAL